MSGVLGERLPIWQAPTGSVAGPELCAAVAQAGGVGGLGLTWTEPEAAGAAVRAVRNAVGDAPFQGNFALAFAPRALEAALAAGLPVVTFSWGDPAPYLPRCRAHGARVGVQVASREEAERMRDLVDFFIVQGVEAGGHVQSATPLLDLLPQIVAFGLPVVAAGGLADGADVRRVLNGGAAAAMLGTRFVATRESRAHPDYKAELIAGKRTELTELFDIGWPGAPHRVLRNSTLAAWEAAGRPPSGARPGEGDLVGGAPGGPILRYEDVAPRAGFAGEIEAMCLYAGTGVDRIDDLPAAGDVVRRLAQTAGIVV